MTVHNAQNKCVCSFDENISRVQKPKLSPIFFIDPDIRELFKPTLLSLRHLHFSDQISTNLWNLSWFLMNLPSNMVSNLKINNFIEIFAKLRVSHQVFQLMFSYWIYVLFHFFHIHSSYFRLLNSENVSALVYNHFNSTS